MDTMTIWQSVVLGVVEGITEYLPISSTGHLIIVSDLLGLGKTATQRSAVDTFNIVVQGGAILAVLTLYFPRVIQMIRGLLGKDADGLKLSINIIAAFMPAAVLGVLLNDMIEKHLFNTTSVITALALGGIFMIALDHKKFKAPRPDPDTGADSDEQDEGMDLTDMSIKQAVFIGFLQTIAMWPGTSRSMMTIAGGVLIGLRPKRAAEFSFLLGLPTLGGACVYSLYKTLSGDGPSMFEVIGWAPIAVGLIVATVSAAFAVRWLVAFLTEHGLALFGYYRIVLAIMLGILIGTGTVSLHTPSQPDDAQQLIDQNQSESDG